MAQAPQVQVIGLRALTKDIARLTDDAGPLYKELAVAGRKAAEPIAAVTRSTLPQDSGRLAGDVRVTASKSGAAVRMGRSSLRYAGWVEFGGTRKTPHTSTRPYQPRGRYLFPSGVMGAPLAASLYTKATQEALDSYPWTNEGDQPHD
jgi:hypothetical protein